jgi:hypothetical protein
MLNVKVTGSTQVTGLLGRFQKPLFSQSDRIGYAQLCSRRLTFCRAYPESGPGTELPAWECLPILRSATPKRCARAAIPSVRSEYL